MAARRSGSASSGAAAATTAGPSRAGVVGHDGPAPGGDGAGVGRLVVGGGVWQGDHHRRHAGGGQLGHGDGPGPGHGQVGGGIGQVHALDEGDDPDQQPAAVGVGLGPGGPDVGLVPAPAGVQDLDGGRVGPVGGGRDHRLVDAARPLAAAEHEQGAAAGVEAEGGHRLVVEGGPVEVGQLGPDRVADHGRCARAGRPRRRRPPRPRSGWPPGRPGGWRSRARRSARAGRPARPPSGRPAPPAG